MNIVFWGLVVLAAIAVWFALSSQFWSIGEMFSDLFHDAKEAINEKEVKEEDQKWNTRD